MWQVVPTHGHGDEAGKGATWLAAVAQPLCAALPSGRICLYSSRNMSGLGLFDPNVWIPDLLAMVKLGKPVREPYLHLKDQATSGTLGAVCFAGG